MKWRAIWPLALDNLLRNRLFGLSATLGVIVGVAVLVLVVALSTGLREHVIARVFKSLPETQVKVSASRMDLGFLNFAKPKFLKGATLSDDLIADITKQPGVQSAYGEMTINFPIKATGSFMGQQAATDLVANGVDPSVLRANLPKPEAFAFHSNPDAPVPAVVSTQLLDLYNTTFAPMNDFPGLSAESLIGFRFDLILGQSYLGGRASKGRPRRVQCELVGFSDKAINIGVTLPLDYVKAWNAEYSDSGPGYRAILVTVSRSEYVDALKAWLEGKGFAVQTAKEGAGRQIGEAIGFLTGLSVGLSALILGLSAANLAFLLLVMVQRRRAEIGLWRTVGATRADIAATILIEAAILGLLGAAFGCALGVLAAQALETAILNQLAGLAFSPPALLAYPGWLWPLSFAFALGFALLGALPPALIAARRDPAEALRLN
jgi:ABC-type antimicrobial peptide transport system permease subunit